MRLLNDVIQNASVGDASFNGTAVAIDHILHAAWQVAWTGDLDGTIQAQASCDDSAPTNWYDISGKTLTPAGSASSGLIEHVDMPWKWIRLTWTRTSGTGTITARIFGKGA